MKYDSVYVSHKFYLRLNISDDDKINKGDKRHSFNNSQLDLYMYAILILNLHTKWTKTKVPLWASPSFSTVGSLK